MIIIKDLSLERVEADSILLLSNQKPLQSIYNPVRRPTRAITLQRNLVKKYFALVGSVISRTTVFLN